MGNCAIENLEEELNKIATMPISEAFEYGQKLFQENFPHSRTTNKSRTKTEKKSPSARNEVKEKPGASKLKKAHR